MDHHIHVPTPGELYSATVGSAITTVIAELSEAHRARGGRTSVVVAAGRPHQARGSDLLTFDQVDRPWVTKEDKVIDALVARLVSRRPRAERVHVPALLAVPESFEGPVFLHNAPHAVGLLRRLRPRALPVLYAHNDLFRSWGPREKRALLRDSHRVVFVSEHLSRTLTPDTDDDTTCRVVLNGADTGTFRPTERRRGPLTVLYVGKITPHKGVDLLVRACAELWRAGLDFRLLVVGREGLSADGPLSTFEREQRVATRPWADRVDWRGFVDRIALPEVFAEADIFCVPSNWDEPCSLTLPEGLAAGLPTVASDRGGLPEVAAGAVLTFTPPDVAQLAAQLARLIDDDALRRDLASAARCRGEELSWSTRSALLSQSLVS